MNRTPSEAAKLLGAEVAQVKRWAFRFKDYLADAANPPSGNVRRFSDSDMLVLMYVQHYWEDDPDVGAIESGLNRGEHLESAFLESLYRCTPLLQFPPDDLDETWRHGILLVGERRYGYLELARNYRHVAEAMLRTALDQGSVEGSAFPILFAYRHTLELYLKLIGEIDEVTHSLKRCVELVEARRAEQLPPPIRGWILELEQVDPAGTAFRYADAGAGSPELHEQWFDLRHFKFAMDLVFDVIDNAILRVGAKGKPARSRRQKSNVPATKIDHLGEGKPP